MRFTIGKKIGFGFGILILMTIFVFYFTVNTLDSSREINKVNESVNTPSVDQLQELKTAVIRSQMLINNWVRFEKDNLDKRALIELNDKTLPALREKLQATASHWKDDEQLLLDTLYQEIDVLIGMEQEVQFALQDFDSYSDPGSIFMANLMVGEDGEIDHQMSVLLGRLNALIAQQRANAAEGRANMNDSFELLDLLVKYIGLALILISIVIAILTVRSIVKPVQQLRGLLLELGKGIIPSEKMQPHNDEIGDMAVALNDLVDGIEHTTDFARAVGAGDFEMDYKPLSDDDTLGKALLRMREDLNVNEKKLQQKVRERTEEVEQQKKEIEGLYEHILDSINYAKRIQDAILLTEQQVKDFLPNSFVLFKPKDIVSGDFYWVRSKQDQVLFAAIDCTGHGVPGAFMTIVGHNGLNHAYNHLTEFTPAKILDELNIQVENTLRKKGGDMDVKDGMDAALCNYNPKTKVIQYAGAYNPLYLIRDGEVQEIKGNKFPVGAFLDGELNKFTNHEVQLQEGDMIYVFSDGYADQFGGPKGKKFMYRRFRELLQSICEKPVQRQKEILNETIEQWRGDLEQVDDIVIIGMKVQ